MSIPLVQEATKDAINTSIIAIKRNIERINMLLGLSNSEEIDTSKFATKDELQQAVTDLQPVDEVAVDNMQSVTSNAVAKIVHWKLLGGFGNDETMTVPKTAKEVKIGAYDQINRYVFNSVSELLADFENDTTRMLISWISGANYPSILYNGKDANGNYLFTANYCATGYTTIVYYK